MCFFPYFDPPRDHSFAKSGEQKPARRSSNHVSGKRRTKKKKKKKTPTMVLSTRFSLALPPAEKLDEDLTTTSKALHDKIRRL